jgi:ribonuclease P protein component
VEDASTVVSRLVRSRPGAASEHFTLHWRSLPDGSPESTGSTGLLLLGVPKRQLRRAVDRNLVRRLAREAWRSSGLSRGRLALLVKLRKRPDWFAEAGVQQKRRALREELDQLLSHRSLPRRSDTLPDCRS